METSDALVPSPDLTNAVPFESPSLLSSIPSPSIRFKSLALSLIQTQRGRAPASGDTNDGRHDRLSRLKGLTGLRPSATAGFGRVVYVDRSDGHAGLETMEFSYPLKLIIPPPQLIQLCPSSQHPPSSSSFVGADLAQTPESETRSVKLIGDKGTTTPAPQAALIHTIFILSYGGGLVGGDQTNLQLTVNTKARVVLLTQGSTKIFKCLNPDGTIARTRATITADLHSSAALVYLPDPVQPFANSSFEQTQVYRLHSPDASICVCDWVCQGRVSRGECWDVFKYSSRNEFWALGWGLCNYQKDTTTATTPTSQARLLLRDNILLSDPDADGIKVSSKVGGMSVFGSLIIGGPMFVQLGRFFLAEFAKLPRIGGRDWGAGADVSGDDGSSDPKAKRLRSGREKWRADRVAFENRAGIVWTATSVRGFVMVKFGSCHTDLMREWLSVMLTEEGTLMSQFGTRPFYCLRS